MTSARQQRFSLLELILVLALLVAAMALVAPQLRGFFAGRRLDGEARRLWALTRYAREQAMAQAVPVELWLDTAARQYGVQALPGYGVALATLTYDLMDGAEVTTTADTTLALAEGRAAAADPSRPRLLWWPDGALAAGSPREVVLQGGDDERVAWRLQRQGALPWFTLRAEVLP